MASRERKRPEERRHSSGRLRSRLAKALCFYRAFNASRILLVLSRVTR